MKLDETKR